MKILFPPAVPSQMLEPSKASDGTPAERPVPWEVKSMLAVPGELEGLKVWRRPRSSAIQICPAKMPSFRGAPLERLQVSKSRRSAMENFRILLSTRATHKNAPSVTTSVIDPP